MKATSEPRIATSLPIPKDWSLSPIVRPCEVVPYSVLSNSSQCQWTMGVSMNPLHSSPALTWWDWRVYFSVLVILLQNSTNDEQISFRQIAHVMGSPNCGKTLCAIRRSLFQLRDFWVGLQRPDGSGVKFPLIEFWMRTRKTGNAEREVLTKIRMHQDFVDLLATESANIRYDQLRAIRSGITASLYLFLPARVSHWKGKASAKVVGFRSLSSALGLDATPSVMKKLLTQNALVTPLPKKGSVVQQLNGLQMRSGTIRCEIVEAGLLLWWEMRIPTSGVLHDAFIRGGGDERTWKSLFLSSAQMMTEKEWGQVQKLGVTVHFQSALHSCAKVLKTFSPPAFSGVISLATTIFPKAQIRNPGKTLFTMLVDVVEDAPKRKVLTGDWWRKPALARRDKKAKETMALKSTPR